MALDMKTLRHEDDVRTYIRNIQKFREYFQRKSPISRRMLELFDEIVGENPVFFGDHVYKPALIEVHPVTILMNTVIWDIQGL